MNTFSELLARHGAVILFAAVFVEQLGLPLPATPWLLAAGALAATGQISWVAAVTAGAFGSLLADAIWFFLGRCIGNRALGFLCRISLEPDSCVRKTHDLFSRYGMRGIIMAKFIPGLSTLAPPLAGTSGVSAWQFFPVDGLASLFYAGGFLAVGAFFSHQLEQVLAALSSLGGGTLGVIIGALALYFGYKHFQRRQFLAQLKMARISVDELYEKLTMGETPVILDLRPRWEIERDPVLIRGARHITMDHINTREQEIPRDRDIVLYCSCPNEASAAHAALLLRKKGFARVRPLLGGINAWRERDYPVEMTALSPLPASRAN